MRAFYKNIKHLFGAIFVFCTAFLFVTDVCAAVVSVPIELADGVSSFVSLKKSSVSDDSAAPVRMKSSDIVTENVALDGMQAPPDWMLFWCWESSSMVSDYTAFAHNPNNCSPYKSGLIMPSLGAANSGTGKISLRVFDTVDSSVIYPFVSLSVSPSTSECKGADLTPFICTSKYCKLPTEDVCPGYKVTAIEVLDDPVNNFGLYTAPPGEDISGGVVSVHEDLGIYLTVYIEPAEYEITLDNYRATVAGTTKIYTKYNTGAYLDAARTKSMTYTANPITIPQRTHVVTLDANGGISTSTLTSVYDFGGYGGYTTGSMFVNFISADGYITNTGLELAKTAEYNDSWSAVWSGGDVTLPTPTKNGYTFAGWYTASGTKIGAAGGTYTPTENITLRAQWTPVVYTITYNLNDGTNPTTDVATSYTIESADITLPTPIKDGYTFGGWYTSSGLTGSAVTKIAKGNTGNKVFYAKWTKKSFTCTAGTYLPKGETTCSICPKTTMNSGSTVGAYCVGGTFSFSETNDQGITACPVFNASTRTSSFPSTTGFVLSYSSGAATAWYTGQTSITQCLANYYFTNEAGSVQWEGVKYNTLTGKYDNGAGGIYYTKLNPGYYLTDRYDNAYCDTSADVRKKLYKTATKCTAGYKCPGYTTIPLCSSTAETYGIEMGRFICTGATYSGAGASVCTSCPGDYTYNTSNGKTSVSSCQIQCAPGTMIASKYENCTSPAGGWYAMSSRVASYGNIVPVNYCMSGYTNTGTDASNHDEKTDCVKTISDVSVSNTIPARYIRLKSAGNTVNNGTHVVEIKAFTSQNGSGTNLLSGKGGTTGSSLTNATDGSLVQNTYSTAAANSYLTWDMGATYDIGVIKFAMYSADNRTYKDVQIEVSSNGLGWTTVLGPRNISTPKADATNAKEEYLILAGESSCSTGYESAVSTVKLGETVSCEIGIYAVNLDSKFYSSSTLSGVTVDRNASPTIIYEKYDDTYYTDSSATIKFTKLTTLPKYDKYVFRGFWTGKSGANTMQIIDASGSLNTAKQKLYTSDGTAYANYEACSCTNGIGVTSCVVSSTNDSNQCVYSVMCDSGYSKTGGINNTKMFSVTGSAGVASYEANCVEKSQFTVILEPNAGELTSFLVGDHAIGITAIYGEAMPELGEKVPDAEIGGKFLGYYDTAASTGGTQYYDERGNSVTVWNKASNATLYGRWKIFGGTLSFNANGGEGTAPNSPSVCTFLSCVAPENTFSRTGYSFSGWYFEHEDAGQVVIQPGENMGLYWAGITMDDKNLELYALWEPIICDAGEYLDGDTCVKFVPEFTITTTDTSDFSFQISAAGTYYLDCGNGKAVRIINKTSTGSETFTCTNRTSNTIGLSGMTTAYTNSTAAISFNGNTKIKSVDGSLGAIFGGSSDYLFYQTFYGCTSLESIPENLFSGVSGSGESMFDSTFSGCISLKFIPEKLFSGVSGSATYMFYDTFSGCTSLQSIPENLFAGVSGSSIWMFDSTFSGCTGLTGYIPPNTFPSSDVLSVSTMNSTFYNTTLMTSCPAGMYQYITGFESAWNDKVACAPCPKGYSCFDGQKNECTAGFYADKEGMSACLACPTGLTTIGYGAGADEEGDCGRILHVDGEKLYLRSSKKTEHALHVKVGESTFFGNMVVGDKKMSDGATKILKIKHNGQMYSVYDDSVE